MKRYSERLRAALSSVASSDAGLLRIRRHYQSGHESWVPDILSILPCKAHYRMTTSRLLRNRAELKKLLFFGICNLHKPWTIQPACRDQSRSSGAIWT